MHFYPKTPFEYQSQEYIISLEFCLELCPALINPLVHWLCYIRPAELYNPLQAQPVWSHYLQSEAGYNLDNKDTQANELHLQKEQLIVQGESVILNDPKILVDESERAVDGKHQFKSIYSQHLCQPGKYPRALQRPSWREANDELHSFVIQPTVQLAHEASHLKAPCQRASERGRFIPMVYSRAVGLLSGRHGLMLPLALSCLPSQQCALVMPSHL